MRAITSTPPPAATGTMIWTGLSGYCARAKPADPMTNVMTMQTSKRQGLFMIIGVPSLGQSRTDVAVEP
jgi:hypothetical protein